MIPETPPQRNMGVDQITSWPARNRRCWASALAQGPGDVSKRRGGCQAPRFPISTLIRRARLLQESCVIEAWSVQEAICLADIGRRSLGRFSVSTHHGKGQELRAGYLKAVCPKLLAPILCRLSAAHGPETRLDGQGYLLQRRCTTPPFQTDFEAASQRQTTLPGSFRFPVVSHVGTDELCIRSRAFSSASLSNMRWQPDSTNAAMLAMLRSMITTLQATMSQ